MTDRKPDGSTPVAPQRPKGSSAQKGAARNGTDPAPTQSMQRVNGASPKNASRPAQGSSGPQGSSATQNSAPATAPPKAKPKTAGEIAAESGPSPAPSAKSKPAVQQSTPPAKAPDPTYDAASARTARLRLARVDPWSVMKVSFALSIALAIVTVIAISIVWFVLGAAGVWDAVNSSVASLLSDNAETFDITEYVGYGRVIGFALLVSAVDVVLITAIATLGAFLYNLAAGLLGGLELTLAEDT
ncbi:DUF3566 domain-containing protein [Solicola gregarius]|uniref:DUF3566 domain-containing protein n=1 Tax=Solicola gregarius TaxID=2908642 RepID=A0AA46TL94_9ACTN|nr:DUF3566 domain-containing protein [Solicola gregarius]UYM07372.1 DUF3566 domain-containing protein [Solicola gregarius]